MTVTAFQHQPVLLAEVLEYLNPVSGGIYLDGTLGGGGHALEVLRLSSPEGRLLGIDRDIEALAAARQKLADFGERLLLFQDNFVNLERVLEQSGIERVDGILLDLGVSSYQLDNPERGFSYMQDAPLDMRMDQSSAYTAYQVVNELSAAELTRIIRDYGEERFAAKIAAALKKSREPIRTTGQLAEIIKAAIPARNRREGPHPAKRTFQAIRIEVNRELEIIPQAILAGVRRLKPQGRLAVISFHSLEDRLVKKTFAELAHPCTCPRDFPVCACGKKPQVKNLTGKGITAQETELSQNPRARSARLRVVEKIGF